MLIKSASLLDGFSCHGFWFLPGVKQPAAGILTFEPEQSLHLELLSLDGSEFVTREAGEGILIYGFTNNNRCFYLVDSKLVNGSALGGSGPSRTVGTYWPKYVVETNSVVPQWKSSDTILMSKMSMSFDNLNSWMNPIPIRGSRPGSRSVTQLLKRPNESAYCVDDEGTMLKFSARYSSLTDQDNPSVPTGTLTTIPLLVVSPTAPKNIDWFRTYFKKLQHMLVVLMGEATNVNHAEGMVEIGDTRRPFLIYWKQSINVKRDTPIAAQNMLVRYSDFRRRKIKVTSWLANYDEIEEQIALIVETILSPGMYREFRWLMLTQAIESFHRKTIGGSHMGKEEYLATVAREIKSSIPSNLPTDHRDSLKSKIDFGYEYSMNRRLKDFLSVLPDELVDGFLQRLGGVERKLFTHRVKETRNYYTHYDQAIFRLNDREQDDYSIVLKQLVLAHLMKRMGFTDSELQKAFFPD